MGTREIVGKQQTSYLGKKHTRVFCMIGMEFSPLITVLESDFNMDSASTTESDTLDDIKQMSKGKPPRHLSSLQHITTTTTTSRLQVAVTAVISYIRSTVSGFVFFCKIGIQNGFCFVRRIWKFVSHLMKNQFFCLSTDQEAVLNKVRNSSWKMNTFASMILVHLLIPHLFQPSMG